MTRRLWLGILNLLAFLLTLTVNAMAVILPLNGKTTQELSDAYPNLFVPAGLTFSIWGVIYLLLGIFCIYGLLPSIRRNALRGEFINRIGWLFIISCILNSSWILAWHYEMVTLSVIIMLALLFTLIGIYLRLGVGKAGAPTGERYLVHVPFSVYLGWISVATIANITALLVSWHWNGFGISEQIWAAIMILVAVILAILMLAQRRDIFYALVVDWAVLGIFLKRLSDNSQPDQTVINSAIAGMIVISLGIIIRIVGRKIYNSS